MIELALSLFALAQAASSSGPTPTPSPLATISAVDESTYYSVDYLRAPEGTLIEVGGMDFLPDDRLVLSTRRGQVWIVDHPLDPDPKNATFHLFAEGLQEGLGLAVIKERIAVVQRGELSFLNDDDHDGRCDTVQTLCNAWGLSGNYHEFAFGLAVDESYNSYVALNVGFWDPEWWHGKSKAPWRGWVIRISPRGEIEPFASGFRSPCGISMSPEQELWVTDNQGDWEPVGPVYQVKKGRFYGHPASLAWTDAYQKAHTEPSDTVPPDVPREAPAMWLPYKWSRSAGNVTWDTSAGKFGPFAGQMFISELTNGMLLRASLERVRGEWQGACFLFRQKLGSTVRVVQARDGTMFCGMTNRGWGGLSPSSGVARVRWTGKTPFEIRDVHLLQDGFDLALTAPLAHAFTPASRDVSLVQYHYDYWWQYGSPERGTKALEVSRIDVSADRTHVTLHVKDLAAGEMVRCVLSGFSSEGGEPLLHDEFAYTLDQLPEGPLCTTPIARTVPPPSGRETEDEGWLRLCYGDAFERWNQAGWKQRDVDIDLGDPKTLLTYDGVGALVNSGPDATDFASKDEFGDAVYSAKFFLPEGGEAQMWLQGRYAVRCAAPARSANARVNLCGAIAASAHSAGKDALLDAWKGPGQWHEIRATFHAPRFDAAGKKTANARIDEVKVDDVVVQRDVELAETSTGALAGEVARGPFVLRGLGTIAMGGVRVKPLDVGATSDAWTPLYDGEDLEGWTASGGAQWKVDDDGVLIGSGPAGWLWTTRDDYTNFELRAKAKISEGGRSALVLRGSMSAASNGASKGDPGTRPEGGTSGYEAVINSSHPDAGRAMWTGSLVGLAPIGVQLIGADSWFDYRISCVDEAGGVRLKVWLDGVQISDVLDRDRRATRGRIGLEQRGEASVVEFRAISIRELPSSSR